MTIRFVKRKAKGMQDCTERVLTGTPDELRALAGTIYVALSGTGNEPVEADVELADEAIVVRATP